MSQSPEKGMSSIEAKVLSALTLLHEALQEDASFGALPEIESIRRICNNEVCVNRVNDPTALSFSRRGTKYSTTYDPAAGTPRVLYDFNMGELRVVAVIDQKPRQRGETAETLLTED